MKPKKSFADLTIKTKIIWYMSVLMFICFSSMGILVWRNVSLVKDIRTLQITFSVVILLFTALATTLFYFIVKRMVCQPIQDIVAVVKQFAVGNVSVRMKAGSNDEIGLLRQTLNEIIAFTLEQAKAIEQIASGDLPVRVQERSEQDVLSHSINQVTHTLRDMIKEVNTLTRAAAEGKLEVRGETRKFSGGYQEIVAGINRTLDVVLEPLNEANEVLGKLAVNDLTAAMTGKYQGLLEHFMNQVNTVRKNMLNVQDVVVKCSNGDTARLKEYQQIGQRSEHDRLVPSLIGLMLAIHNMNDEVEMLTAAAVSGNLKVRGDASKFAGGYQTVVTEFNQTLDAMNAPIIEALQVLKELADGNLQVSMDGTYQGEHAALKTAVNQTIAAFDQVLGEIEHAAEQVASGAHQVSNSSQVLAQASSEQAGTMEEISASIEEIAGQTKKNADNASQANQLALAAQDQADRGNQQMQTMMQAIIEINQASASIAKIIKVIDEIAFQTNILALNAAVEAAHAGQHGKGFAVVAEEVRTLAARSAKAAKETTALIEESINKVATGTAIAKETAAALNQIVAGVGNATALVGEIAIASNEQATAVAQINQGIAQISQVTQTNTATVEESAAASEELSNQSERLKQMVDRFSLKQQVQSDQPQRQPQHQTISALKGQTQTYLTDQNVEKY
jgi:methyl-accepting chemotaxis protein